MTDTESQLKEARAEHEALAKDLPNLEALLEKRDQAIRGARDGGKNLEAIADLRSRRDGVARPCSHCV